ncbi:MAG: MFS transporter [Phormidesmis sp.]
MTSLQIEATQAQPVTPLASARSVSPVMLPASDVRRSLRASTLDGTFSSVFENVVKGVLISNFLLGLGAGAFEIGLLTSIPMVAHLLQPLGAYFSEKTKSRHLYCLWIYGTARLLWLLPAAGIFAFSHGMVTAHTLTLLTMAVLTLSNILDGMGCASWMSWMAVLVPSQLRGRYFGLRRSLSSLVALLTIPIGGWLVSQWMGGEIEGYGIALIIAVITGLVSLGFQFWINDVNPQDANAGRTFDETSRLEQPVKQAAVNQASVSQKSVRGRLTVGLMDGLMADRNFLTLLFFLGVWTFAVNLSAPFFNYYLLDKLHLDVQWVTLYNSLRFGAFFVAIILWGRLADRIGNRPVIAINAVLAAAIPLFWTHVDSGLLCVWLGLPLLHLLQGTSFAALELCLANIQLEVAPLAKQSSYFAIAAAVIGVTGALGTTAGSFLAELPAFSLPALFAMTALIRLVSIAPLFWVREERAVTLVALFHQQRQKLSQWWQPVKVKV